MTDFRRKVQAQNGSYIISIPKDIMINLGIKKGDMLLITEKEEEIRVRKERAVNNIVYTIGYEKKTLPGFENTLREHGIEEVIDVRNNPFSWKKEFMRENLNNHLQSQGFKYVNIPALGAPKDMRYEIKNNNNPALFFEKYRGWLEKHIPSFELIVKLANDNISAIMCLEQKAEDCHRSVLAEKLEKSGFEVVNL